MANICFLGAGSAFVEPLAADLMHVSALDGSTLHLVDIDEERLELSLKIAELINQKIADREPVGSRERMPAESGARGDSRTRGRNLGGGWKIAATTDRRQALPGADYIINCIEVSGLGCVRADNDIPLKYGVSQCIGDTIGPGGLFKGLRTIPVWLDVLKDCEQLCPDAWVLSYTNPMSMMCLAAFRRCRMRIVGLCHSVQETSRRLAEYAGVPFDELEWDCGGINHMAWFTTLRHRGADLYPVLRQKVESDRSLWEKDPVRFDVMLHFGAFVTESSGHLSEYVPYYRKRPELRKQYCRERYLGQDSFYADEWPRWRREADERRRRIVAGQEPLPELRRSTEYASYIIEARETNVPCIIHGNVPNGGLIENLPPGGCVEVACAVDRRGVHPTRFGPLPPQMAALCAANMAVFELGATAAIERSQEAAIHALMLDPLTAAVCCPGEIRRMAEEMFEAEREFLPGFR